MSCSLPPIHARLETATASSSEFRQHTSLLRDTQQCLQTLFNFSLISSSLKAKTMALYLFRALRAGQPTKPCFKFSTFPILQATDFLRSNQVAQVFKNKKTSSAFRGFNLFFDLSYSVTSLKCFREPGSFQSVKHKT